MPVPFLTLGNLRMGHVFSEAHMTCTSNEVVAVELRNTMRQVQQPFRESGLDIGAFAHVCSAQKRLATLLLCVTCDTSVQGAR